MRCSPPRSLLATVLALPVAFAAVPARAQDAPLPTAPLSSPQSAPPSSPPPQPLPWYAQPAPYYPPAPYYQPPSYAPPVQSVQPAPDREHAAPGDWYGWQTLIAVAPFDIAMFAGLAHLSTSAGVDTFAVAFTARNLVPATVHFAHGATGRGFASVGLQAASTATGLALGYALGLAAQGPCTRLVACHEDVPPGPLPGAVVGSMVGTVLDVVFFAHRSRLSWTAAQNEPSWTMAPFATQRSVGMAAGWTL